MCIGLNMTDFNSSLDSTNDANMTLWDVSTATPNISVTWTVDSTDDPNSDLTVGAGLYKLIDKNTYAVVILCIAVIGAIGNVMLLLLMSLKSFRKFSYSVYLRYLAIFDTFVLIQTVTEDTLEKFHGYDHLMEIFYTKTLPCYFWSAPLSISRFISPWLVAALGLDRFIAVVFPLKRNSLCTKRKAHICTLIVTIAAIVLQVSTVMCDPGTACYVDADFCKPFDEHAVPIFVALMIIQTNMPLLIIFVVTTWTIITLRRQMTAFKGESTRHGNSDRKQAIDRTSIALVAVATISFVALFPKAVVEIVEFVYDESYSHLYDKEWKIMVDFIWHICNAIMLLNFAQNFYILVSTSPVYRKSFLRICHKEKRHVHSNQTAMSTSSNAANTTP